MLEPPLYPAHSQERNAELADRLAALSAATSAAPGTLSPSRNATPNATLGRTSGNGAGSGGLSAMASAASLHNGGGTGGTPSGLLSPGTLRVGSGTGQGGGGGLGPPGAGGLGVGLGSSVDLDVLRAQVRTGVVSCVRGCVDAVRRQGEGRSAGDGRWWGRGAVRSWCLGPRPPQPLLWLPQRPLGTWHPTPTPGRSRRSSARR